MVFKPIKTAEKIWRLVLAAKNQLLKFLKAVKFTDGYEIIASNKQAVTSLALCPQVV
jgi:hypothetical protein